MIHSQLLSGDSLKLGDMPCYSHLFKHFLQAQVYLIAPRKPFLDLDGWEGACTRPRAHNTSSCKIAAPPPAPAPPQVELGARDARRRRTGHIELFYTNTKNVRLDTAPPPRWSKPVSSQPTITIPSVPPVVSRWRKGSGGRPGLGGDVWLTVRTME